MTGDRRKKDGRRTPGGEGVRQLREAWEAIYELERQRRGPACIYKRLRDGGLTTLSYSGFYKAYHARDVLGDLREKARERAREAQIALYKERRAVFAGSK